MAQTEPAGSGIGLWIAIAALIVALVALALAVVQIARISARITLMQDRALKQDTELSTLRSRLSGLDQSLSELGQSVISMARPAKEAPVVREEIAAPPPAPAEAEVDDLQSSLPLPEDPADWPDAETLLRALNFPQDADDSAGFLALRRARNDPQMGTLLRAAEDVLTILSQDGTYMDDLQVPPPDAALWRAFAEGTRGAEVTELGAITDPEVITRTATRMREDPIFRDAALHFLQRFDRMLARFAPDAPDAALDALGVTRTARGFMLLARVAGSFD